MATLSIVGSCSRVTHHLVRALAPSYSRIVISDLLPTYCFHQRYYALRKSLAAAKIATPVQLTKLITNEDLYKGVHNFDDVLFVTHDYYHSVSSKTKIMELVAKYGSERNNLYFATPAEYDHYGFANPEGHYLQSQAQVQKIAPNSTFIRSDIQDKTQLFSYLQNPRSYFDEYLLKVPASFKPRLVSSQHYAQVVADTLQKKVKGSVICVRGEKEVAVGQADSDRDIPSAEYFHQRQNWRRLVNGYRGIEDKSSTVVESKA